MKIHPDWKVHLIAPVQGRWFVCVNHKTGKPWAHEATAIVYYETEGELCAEHVAALSASYEVWYDGSYGREYVGLFRGATREDVLERARDDIELHIKKRQEEDAKEEAPVETETGGPP